MRRARAIAAFLILWPAVAAGQTSIAAMRPAIAARFPEVRWVDSPTLRRWTRDPRPLVLLDARQPAEVAVSRIAGATRIDPDHPDVAAVRPPENARVVVYCSVGWRSASVADALRRHGVREVYNLEGGIFAWANQGFEVVRDGSPVRAVHPYDETWGLMLAPELRAYR
ncbi:MAG: rhodanese-like domain-containing protein [Myxococcales bacterium]|nr:rhodanese-like domain-containing protein [Myxococcales bacterium]